MWPPEHEVSPHRSWGQLVEVSRQRGMRLRRRRRLRAAAPVLALVVLLAVPYATPLGRPDLDALVTDTATPDDRPPREALLLSPEAPQAERVPVEPAPAPAVPGRPGTAPEGAAPPASPSPPAPAAPPASPRAAASPVPSPTGTGTRVVDVVDAVGDGYTHVDEGGQVTADRESAPARDILTMRFAAGAEGVRVTMELAGDRDAGDDHYAFLTDARSGCQIDLAFGSRGVEGYYAQCPDGSSSPFVEVPHVEDPSPRVLVVQLPYRLFPSQVDPARPLSELQGQTRRRHGLQGQFRADTASTSQVLAGRTG